MDRNGLAEFLRVRREALQPEDVGLPRGPRRRTGGLRREEIAALVGMSVDYYSRIERAAGPQPSEQMISAMASGLRLSLAERDHLFLLAGHAAPRRTSRTDHVAPGVMRILDRLADAPAQIMGGLGETLVQTRPAAALLSDQTRYAGQARSVVYRWFTDPPSRDIYVAEDHPTHARAFVAQLQRAVAAQGPNSPAAKLAQSLLHSSPEFATLWLEHTVDFEYSGEKPFNHPTVGRLDLYCQTLSDPDRAQTLLVFTATPGTESNEKLALLTVLAGQNLAAEGHTR